MSFMKISRFLSLAFVLLTLSACGSGFGIATAAFTMDQTRPDALPPADLSAVAATHESWCYRTLGTVDCFSQPQPNQGARLVNVDPENRFPLTPQAYNRVATPAP